MKCKGFTLENKRCKRNALKNSPYPYCEKHQIKQVGGFLNTICMGLYGCITLANAYELLKAAPGMITAGKELKYQSNELLKDLSFMTQYTKNYKLILEKIKKNINKYNIHLCSVGQAENIVERWDEWTETNVGKIDSLISKIFTTASPTWYRKEISKFMKMLGRAMDNVQAEAAVVFNSYDRLRNQLIDAERKMDTKKIQNINVAISKLRKETSECSAAA